MVHPRQVAHPGALVVLVLAGFLAFATHPVGASSGRHMLRGHLVPRLAHQRAKGNADGASALDLSIALNLRDRAGLAALLREQDDPHSSLYHQYLTPAQFKQRFSPRQADVDAVTAYLRQQGLRVRSVSPDNTLIDAGGSVATVQQAFGVQIQDFDLDGRTVHAPVNEPSVPDALGGVIAGIGGMEDVAVAHALGLQHVATPSSRIARERPPWVPAPAGYTPSELRNAYEMNQLDRHRNPPLPGRGWRGPDGRPRRDDGYGRATSTSI